jgi:hypothetical protein
MRIHEAQFRCRAFLSLQAARRSSGHLVMTAMTESFDLAELWEEVVSKS